MRMVSRLLAWLACVATVVPFAAPARAASIFTQPVCAAEGTGPCKFFDFDDPIPLIRGLRFTLPRAGSALVTFHGSLVCATSTDVNSVVDLVSQITTTTGEVPSVTSPSGLRLAILIRGAGGPPAGTSDSFNLASTRVINYSTAGDKTVYFKFNRLRMDKDTSCYVYNASFSVVTTP